ncbi:bifunctional diaminohydroxyphosphoribosylaminopyrimidine deaminase/5-amino-6-(5-phosphoribosylamino)uracil reductase RibD [Halomonas halocynthiae]|uniref:bifunctional diaminohydroxyphosphoribosylaminopyrimidine deaminase/5-amino-6-(5-phosphoribosylamino)uracil reductase RibD n=1 Tax=Halomonas halocynthiae TaxID=176290 RepID=UPI0004122B68|nr:bifunctional diaminohydroxyphosphoribosylaminopyrimidine deaminase/5-amino-6-(5-phosphoribosylamino)uracil reductase RibD [Halomonas halocynthiae]
MSRALILARRGLYTTQPNPRVGCVLVRDGHCVGEGWHERAGQPHAEINALAMAGDAANGATAYVTLEPCSHYGRTGPCADALVAAGVTRVIAAMQDPNPQVAGNGMARLKAAGIEVQVGLLESEARALNAGYIRRMSGKLPFVRLKMAMSLDGRTAMQSGESQWITGPFARREVQRLRARSCAVMSGVDSIIADDSRLTVRAEQLGLADAEPRVCQQPLRVILDSRLRLPPNAACLREPGRTLIATCEGYEVERRARLEAAGADLVVLPAGSDGRIDLAALLAHLARCEQVSEVLLETGATLAGAMLDAQLVDEMQLFVAPMLLGGDARPVVELPGLTRMAQQRPLEIRDIRALGNDWRITAVPCPCLGSELSRE